MNDHIQILINRWEEKTGQVNLSYHIKILQGMLYWLAGQIHNKQGRDYYIKAFNLLNEAYKENPVDQKISLFIIHLNLQLERYDEADQLLKPFLKLKKYYKTTDKTVLGVIYYLKVLLDYYRGKHMSIQRSIKIFEACLEEQNRGVLFFLKAKMEKELFEEDQNEAKYYYEAFTNGFRSPFLYLEVYRLFSESPSSFYNMKDLLRFVFIWATRYKFLDKESTRLFMNWMVQDQTDLKIPSTYIEFVYKKWDMNETLGLLCNLYIKENKQDEVSLEIYQRAIERRIFVKDIYIAYFETAYRLCRRDIPLSILQSALLKETFDEPLTAFLYSILCTGQQYKMLFLIHYQKILAFGENALRNNKKGKNYIDLYIKLLEKNSKDDLLRKAVFEHLFLYEITICSPLIKYIWVFENEKQNMATYIVQGDTLYIETASYQESEFTILCVGQRQKSFYTRDFIKIEKLIKEIPSNILLEYYDDGYRNADLLIILTKHFIDLIQKDVDISSISSQAPKIMMECLENSALSDDFRRETSAALGSLLARKNDLEKAAPYFKLVDPIDLTSSQIEEGINSLIAKEEIPLAIEWAQKIEEISIESNFKLIQKAIDLQLKHPLVISRSYELLLKGKYSRSILEYILLHYEGSLKDWYMLRDALISLGKPTFLLDKKVLERGIWIRGLDQKLEEIFQAFYEKEKDSPIIRGFIRYCSYEVLVNKKSVSRETLKKLEKVFQETKDMILGSAMLHVYPNFLDQIKDKREIIMSIFQWMERNQFIFPIVKEKKDKFPYFPYIEKNIPFIHHTSKAKEVYFCYKVEGFPLIRKRMYPIAFGLYGTCVSLFYNENMEYYIEETDEEGTYTLTEVQQYHYDQANIINNPNKLYEKLNNAVIYSQNLEFEKTEKILENLIYENQKNHIGYLL